MPLLRKGYLQYSFEFVNTPHTNSSIVWAVEIGQRKLFNVKQVWKQICGYIKVICWVTPYMMFHLPKGLCMH